MLAMKKYIRFGRVPANERSSIHRRGELVGYEKGVSVWNCYYDVKLKQYVGVMPDNKTEDTEDDFNHYFQMCNRDKIPYLVTGDEVGTGSDNEPLLVNVLVLRQLKNSEVHDPYEDRKNDTSVRPR